MRLSILALTIFTLSLGHALAIERTVPRSGCTIDNFGEPCFTDPGNDDLMGDCIERSWEIESTETVACGCLPESCLDDDNEEEEEEEE